MNIKARAMTQIGRIITGFVFISILNLYGVENYNWPNHRGINHDGISKEVGLNIKNLDTLWKAHVNIGFSAITVVNDKMYTMGNKNDRDIIYCLDTKTGNKVWEYGYSCKLDPNYYEGGPNATPTIHKNKVYTLSREGHIFCLDAEKGRVLWSKNVQDIIEAKPPSWGFSGSPTIIGNSVIYNIGSKGLALEKDTGKVIWSSSGKSAGYASATPFNNNGQPGILMFTGNELKGVDPRNGTELWSYVWKTSYNVNAADPIVFNDYVFISSGYNEGCSVVDISGSKPIELWTNKKLRNQFSSSILTKGKIYGIDGNTGRRNKLVCLNSINGEVLWSQKDFGFGSLILADGKLFILRENGELVIIEAKRDKYSELVRKKILNGKCWTVPTICNRTLFARDADGALVCLDLRGK